MTATKTSLKKWIQAASNFIVLVPSCLIPQMLANFFGVEIWRTLSKSKLEKKKESCCLVFPSLQKIRYFHVIVVQRWLRKNVEKSMMQMRSCCCANLNLLLFCRSGCHRRQHCWSSLLLLDLYAAYSQGFIKVLNRWATEFETRAKNLQGPPGLAP